MNDLDLLPRALAMLAQELSRRSHRVELVLLGGASLRLRQLTSRATSDVDVMGVRLPDGRVASSHPLDDIVADAARSVGAALGLSLDPLWLDDRSGREFRHAAPVGFEQRLERMDFAGMTTWLMSRDDIVLIKILVAAEEWRDARTKHWDDLIELGVTLQDVARARADAITAWTSATASWADLDALEQAVRDGAR